jgi:DNA-directed RNA polymerase subunit RPC12/RpoP
MTPQKRSISTTKGYKRNKEGRKAKCLRCKYVWKTKSKARRVTCPNCGYKAYLK